MRLRATMKVLFIYPSVGSQLGFNYGVASMAAVLKRRGHKASLWQISEELEPPPSEEEFVSRIEREGPDVLGFSVVTNQWGYVQKLAGWARKRFSIPLALGGVHSLTGAEQILATGLFDYVFRGECEEAFAEFMDKLRDGASVKDVRNLAFVEDGRFRVNPMRELPELTALPRKDYEISDFQRLTDVKDGWVGLMASRGCPFSCTYCFNHQMAAAYKRDLRCGFSQLNYVRHHTVGQLIDEIKYLLSHYRNIRMFIFDDDLFTYNADFVREFCRAYGRTSKIPFVVNGHVGFFDERRARQLASAGCRIVKFGVESGSGELREKILNRRMSNAAITEAINLVERFGMHSSVFLIIGFPYETRENVFETIELMGRALPGRFRWTYFFPYPGTKAHQISVEGGFINEEKMKQAHNFTDESCLNFGPEQNLFLQKVGRIMPWFVNAYSRLPVSGWYRKQVDDILAMDARQWQKRSAGILQEDERISRDFCNKALSHYAIKYNRFMGVISDYFLNER